MRKILVLAWRDYKETVCTKSFFVVMALLPIALAVCLGIPALVGAAMLVHDDLQVRSFAVIDRTPGEKVFAQLQASARTYKETYRFCNFELERVEPSVGTPEAVHRQRLDLSARVQRGDIGGLLEIGPDVCRPTRDDRVRLVHEPAVGLKELGQRLGDAAATDADERVYIRYQSNRLVSSFPAWAEQAVNEAILRQRWLNAGMPEARLPSLQPVTLEREGLTLRDIDTGASHDEALDGQRAPLLVPCGLVFLMYMMISMGSSTALMHRIKEEKMQRITEILLGSVRPFELMMGKLLGSTGIFLTIATLYAGAAFWMGRFGGLLAALTFDVLAWFVVYLVLAMMMYGSLALAIGATTTDVQHGTEIFHLPIYLITVMSLAVSFAALQNPNGSFATWISFFPFATPMVMVSRLATPPGIAWWQPALGVVPVLATTIVCVWMAGRIFRVGILMQGQGPKLRDLCRWIVYG